MTAVNCNLEHLSIKLRACTVLPEYDLWQSLCDAVGDGIQVLRQVVVGGCIADIYCPTKQLVIQVGGDSVEWAQTQYDKQEGSLNRLDLKTLVVQNIEIKESLEELVNKIVAEYIR